MENRPMAKRHSVEVTLVNPSSDTRTLLECLRYAGTIVLHTEIEDDNPVFDLHCPRGISDTETWARMNVNRIRSFGPGLSATTKLGN